MTPLFGAYMNQPPSAPPPRNQLGLRKRPPAAKHQKLKAINAQLAQYNRQSQITLLLVVVLNVVILALLGFLLLGHD